MKQAIECAALIMWLIGGILLMIGCGKMILEGWPWRMKKELAAAREENEKLRKELEEARDDLRVEKAYREPQHFNIETVKVGMTVDLNMARAMGLDPEEFMDQKVKEVKRILAVNIAKDGDFTEFEVRDEPETGFKFVRVWVNIAKRIK